MIKLTITCCLVNNYLGAGQVLNSIKVGTHPVLKYGTHPVLNCCVGVIILPLYITSWDPSDAGIFTRSEMVIVLSQQAGSPISISGALDFWIQVSREMFETENELGFYVLKFGGLNL